MNYQTQLKWLEPLEFAKIISQNYEQDWIFLNSGLSQEIKNSKSYIALFPQENFIFNKIDEIKNLLNQSHKKYFGYISYEAFRDYIKTPSTKNSLIELPIIQLIDFATILEFDHDNQNIIISYQEEQQLEFIKNCLKSKQEISHNYIEHKNITSNFSDESYLKTINNIKEQIAAGDFYQVNLTRKFSGQLKQKYHSYDIFYSFYKLCQISPANYSSFIKINNQHILSSSPELFINIADNIITSRPIKGTAATSTDPKINQNNKDNLQNSSKERAENLMIVDLVRNDLSQICQVNSIKVDNLFKVNSYKTLHHMSSQISGIIDKNHDPIDAIKATFPPGSMTGAPKIAAMKNIAHNEKINRNLYSGTIGFISQNHTNLSVVIRTLIIKDNDYQFQVGGAITHDSNPQKELEETYHKAKALEQIIGVKSTG